MQTFLWNIENFRVTVGCRLSTIQYTKGVKKNRLAFEKTLLPEYQSNYIENSLVLLLICSIRFINLSCFNQIPSRGYGVYGSTSAGRPFENLQKQVKTASKFPWVSLLTIMTHPFMHFVLLGEWNLPEQVIHTWGKTC